MNSFSYKKILLDSGLTIILIPNQTVQSVYLRVDIRCGSIFEDETNNGVSHLLEHYLHEGNKQIKDAIIFSQTLEKEGIYQNAATNLFGTSFYMKSPHNKAEKVIDAIFSTLFQPIFPPARLEHVKNTVLQEYYDYWQFPENIFYKNANYKRYIDKPPYLLDAIGTEEVIKKISLEEIINWHKRFYSPANMLITVAGKIDSKMVEKLKVKFGDLKKGLKVEYPPVSTNHYSDKIIYHKFDNRNQITFSLSFPTFGWNTKGRHEEKILSVLTRLIASARFSRLYNVLREKHNLVYGVQANTNLFPERGVIWINGSTSKENIVKTIRIIKRELEKIKKFGFNQEEITIAKNIYESSLIFEQETPEGVSSLINGQEFFDLEVLSPERTIKEIASISKRELDSMGKEIFDFEKLNLGLFGDLNDKDIDEINSIF